MSRNEKRATLLGGICADGHPLKPMLILQRETMEAELLNSGYTNDKVHWGRSPTGFMNTDLFMEWARLSFFPELQRRRIEHDYGGPALLLLDGFGVHHTEAFDELCHEANLVLRFIPPHTSDQLQAMDLGIFAVQKRWQSNITVNGEWNWQTKRAVKILDSYRMATTPKNVIGAFRISGIVCRYDQAQGTILAHVDPSQATRVRHVHAEPQPWDDRRRIRI